jgi:lysophospholipase L1-like esterase
VRLRTAGILLLIMGSLTAGAVDDIAPLSPGEVVCFIGDSITHSGQYHIYLAAYHATRFPDRPVKFYNLGIGGHTAELTLVNFGWDVLKLNPAVVVVMLGMNDMGHRRFSTATRDAYVRNMQKLITRIKTETSAELILISPPPYDGEVPSSQSAVADYNDALGVAAGSVVKLAMSNGAQYVDFHSPMTALMDEIRQSDPNATLISTDRVHPGVTGNLVMAYLFLKAQGVPSVVSDVQIDAMNSSVLKSGNCEVSELGWAEAALQFDLQAHSLPFPLPESDEARKALRLVPIESNLNQELLSILNLPSGNYALRIDSLPIGQYSADRFAAGINLALNPNTPQYRQAQEVLKLLEQKNEVEFKLRTEAALKVWLHQAGIKFSSADREYVDSRFRSEEVQSLFAPGGRMASGSRLRYWNRYLACQDSVSTFSAEIERLLRQVYEINKPGRRHYLLVRCD